MGSRGEDEAWFGVSLLYEREPLADVGVDEGLFEEQVILVRAPSEEAATVRAAELAPAGAHTNPA